MNGDVGTEDANGRPYLIRLKLKLLTNLLNGPAEVSSFFGPHGTNTVTQWVELKKN